jgi:hypothetical protein
MTTRALILSLMLFTVLAACVVACSEELPEAIGYEQQHQHAIAHLKRPVSGYDDYMKFVAHGRRHGRRQSRRHTEGWLTSSSI